MDAGAAWIALCNRNFIALRTISGWHCEMKTDRMVDCSNGAEQKSLNHSQFLQAFNTAVFQEVENNDK